MLDCVTEELVMSLELGEGEEEVVYDWPPTLGSTSKKYKQKKARGLERHESRENIIKYTVYASRVQESWENAVDTG